MLYRILQFLMKRSLVAHYLEVKGVGFNNIPKKGPLLVAATHPNSFLDAIILATLIKRPLHFLARSDVFNSKLSNYILRKLNLIPIYRLQEGHENLNRNDQTFKECYKILEEDGAILIFVEGISLIDMKLRPLKKGLARIAFGFAEKNNFNKNCSIVPVGLNYDRPKDFRSKINVGVGQIQKILDYQENYEINKSSAYSILNEVLFKELREHTVEVKEENYIIYKALAELDNCFGQNSLARKRLIANHIVSVSESNPNTISELKKIVKESFALLKQYKLNYRKLKVNAGISIKDVILILLASPLAMVAFIFNFIPMALAKVVSDKTVKLDEFYASVRLVLDTILWLIWTLIFTIVFTQITIWGLVTPIVFYSLVQFYLNYYEKVKYVMATYRLTKLKKEKEKFNHLQHLIKQIYRLRSKGLSPAC